MEEQSHRTINPIIMVALFVQIIFIIVAILSIRQVLESNQPSLQVEVTGLTTEIEGLAESNKEIIEHSVYQAISINSPSSNISKTGVNIRDGSLINRYFEEANMHYANFIADIPNASQSYQVAYVWSDDQMNKYVSPDRAIAVTCLAQEQLIYGDFNCSHSQDKYKMDMVMMVIRALQGKSKADSDVVLSIDPYTGYDDFKIRINYALCDSMCICKKATEEGKQRALAEYDQFMRDLGYSPDDISHYFYNCENEIRILNEENVLINQ